ncbi:MAG: 5-deoxy-glucuronate isomerase [Oscillospiraceae bacterium]|nr:5-deoxy-glucuronate isomerase [Oscillospiraceae bacterium]
MNKVFGYPQFNGKGEKILTTYEGDYSNMLMDIRVYRLRTGERRRFFFQEEECAVLLQAGDITLAYEGNENRCRRKDVFSEGLWCLHVCFGVEVVVTANMDSQILVQRTHNAHTFASKLYSPQDAPWQSVCKGMFDDTANRRVSTVFDHSTAPYSNMVIGEVLNDSGNWSGYIPHHHPQPEVYYFKFNRPEGFGASFVGDDVYKITDGSFSAIPGGLTHPQANAPGFLMYTCWMIRHLDGDPWVDRIDDERYVWLYG